MSIWDKISDGWGWVKDTGSTIGGALVAANNWITDIPVFGTAVKEAESGVGAVAGGIDKVMYFGVSRPLSTGAQMLGGVSPGTAWRNSEKITPGQAVVIDWNRANGNTARGAGTWGMDPETEKARDLYFHNSAAGQLVSGGLDLAVNLLGFKLGGALKAGAVATTTVKDAAQAGRAMSAARLMGEARVAASGPAASMVQASTDAGLKALDLSWKENRLAKRMDKWLASTDNKSLARIAEDPWLRDLDQGPMFAGLLSQANTVQDVGERLQVKQAIMGTIYGESEGVSYLANRAADIYDAIDNLSKAPTASTYILKHSFDPAQQGSFLKAQIVMGDAQRTYEKARLQDQADRLTSIVGADGSGVGSASHVPTVMQSTRAAMNFGVFGARPVRVMQTSTMNRLQGMISSKDPVAGYRDLDNYTKQAIWLDKDTRNELLQAYANAANTGQRVQAIEDAVRAVNRSAAGHYGVPAETADKMADLGRFEADQIKTAQLGRKYSAVDDSNYVLQEDPATGALGLIPRPLMETQLDSGVSVPNPRVLERTWRRNSNNRLLDHIPVVGTPTSNIIGGVGSMASDAATVFAGAWRDAQLMFRGAYPQRILIDDQLRLATKMGSLQTLGALGRNVWNLASKKGGDRVPLSDVIKGDTDAAVAKYLTHNGIDPDRIPAVLRSFNENGGTIAALLDVTSTETFNAAIKSGSYAKIGISDPNWWPAYRDAIGEIQGSPTALAALRGFTTGEPLRDAFAKSGDAMREWRELRNGRSNELDEWLQAVEDHVAQYVPDPELAAKLAGEAATGTKAAIRGKRVTLADAKKAFGDQLENAPEVHGASYSPLAKDSPHHRVMAQYNKGRSWWFKFAGDAPSTVLSKGPLFAWSYNRNFRELVKRLDDGAGGTIVDINNIRNTASRLARREVGETLFNAAHTSNLSYTLRYAGAFLPAWEDTMRKWGGLIYEHPEMGAKLAALYLAPNKLGVVQDEYGNTIDSDGAVFDAQGNRLDPEKDKLKIGKQQFMVIPAKFVPKPLRDATGINDFRISKNSINVVFQGDPFYLPGAGPLLQVSATELLRHSSPDLAKNPLLQWILPLGAENTGSGDSILSDVAGQLAPSWVKQVRNVMGGTRDWAEVYKTIAATEQAKADQGLRNAPTPSEINNKVRMWFLVRAFASNTSPVSVRPTPESQFYLDQYHAYQIRYARDPKVRDQYLTQYGPEKGQLMYDRAFPDAAEKFYQDHPGWFDMTASLSANSTGILATLNTANAYKQYADQIQKHGQWGWAIVGPDNVYGNTEESVYNPTADMFLQEHGARGTTDHSNARAWDAVQTAETNKGWIDYHKVDIGYRLMLEERGLKSYNDKGAEDIKADRAQFIEELGKYNTSWYREYKSYDQAKAVQFLTDMNDAIKTSPKLAQRADMQALQQYEQGRIWVQQQLADRKYKTLGAKSNQDLSDAWHSLTAGLIQNNIGFEMMYNRVLEHDNLDLEIGTGQQ